MKKHTVTKEPDGSGSARKGRWRMKRGTTQGKAQASGRSLDPIVLGDYVLATKYSDGDPCDHFFVGFFVGMLGDRYLVADDKGVLARANGFRRCERISGRVGSALVMAMPIIGDVSGKSIWWWRRHVKELERLTENK